MGADPTWQPDPLRVERLFLHGFRNLARLDLSLGPRFTVVSGDNGQGKSNLLEALYYLGSLRSFRGAKKDDLIAHDQEVARLAARFVGGSVSTAKITLSRSAARKVALDDKRPRSTAHWLLQVPMVLFHPGELALVQGAPDGRRAFLDRLLEQVDGAYSKLLADYRKALRSRNRLLQEGQEAGLKAFDDVLVASGIPVIEARHRLSEELQGPAQRVFSEIGGLDLEFRVAYRPRTPPDAAAFRRALERDGDKDRARGFTGAGPHGDDLAMTVRSDRAARHHASQGQHRIMVLALRVASLEVLSRRAGRVPILLLDDVSSELDRDRNRRFFGLLARLGGQVLLTTTHPEWIELAADRRDLHVRAGEVREVERNGT